MAEPNPQPNNELPATPPAPPDPRVAAEAALAQVLDQRRDAERKKIEDSEVVDPDARPQRYNQQPASNDEPEPKAPEKPRLIEGASTEERKPTDDGDKLLDRAVAVNIPLEDAQAMSRNTLRRLVVQAEQRNAPPQQQTQTAQQQAEEPLEEELLPAIESGTDEYEVLPGIKQFGDKAREVILRQQQQIDELTRRDQERQHRESLREQQTAERSFGRLIAADTDLHDELGSTVGYPDDPAQMKARGEMWEYYRTAINRGKEPEEAYKVARRAVYGEKVADQEARKTSERAEAVAKRHLSRPAGGKPKELPLGRERAIKELEAYRTKRVS